MSTTVLLLGLGNVLYGDEGVGVHMLHYLRRKYRFGAEVALRDGGALGWHLVPIIAAYERVLIIDAVAGEVGAIYRFTHHDIPSAVQYGKLSSHEWEVPELLTAIELHGDLPEVQIVAIGVNPTELVTDRLSFGLSETIRGRLGALEQVILATLAHWGIAPQSADPHVSLSDPLDVEALVHHA
jgi:hydrogenase maturation protease